MGNKPAQELFDRVKIERKNVNVPARGFSDYKVIVDGKEPDDFKTLISI
jgi:hypothetical protein